MTTKKKIFSIVPSTLPHSDPRYISWLDSLKKRPSPWNKGKTKHNSESVLKISSTMRKLRIDNFRAWREQRKEDGLMPSAYPPFERSENLAILTGLILGDGNIHEFPRTEKLTLVFGTDKPKLIVFATQLVTGVIGKQPKVLRHGKARAVRITLYQKKLSERFGIPSGARKYSKIGVPQWVWSDKKFVLACLRGLFEAEASLSIHLPTCTYNFAFSNLNEKLLQDVTKGLKIFGLHPEIRSNAIRLRKRSEVEYFEKLISFRNY